MTSELKVDKITPASGTNTQIGEAGDTTNLSAGTVTLPTSIITGQSAKTSLADADKFLISDSAASGAFKYVESQYIGGGALVLLGSAATNNSDVGNLTFDNVFDSTYTMYRVMGVASPSSANKSLQFEFRTGSSGSNSTKQSGYNWVHHAVRVDSSDSVGEDSNGDYNTSAAKMSANGVQFDSSSAFTSFDMVLGDPNTDLMSRCNWHGTISYQNPTSGRHFIGTFGGSNTDNPNATGITFSYHDAINIKYGRISVYGVKHA